jgi:hypothetical protein
MAGQILASIDDINGNLDDVVIQANDENTDLIQISVARVIRGYLSRIFPTTILVGWDTPDHTPEIIREIAGMLIAAQHYYVQISAQSNDILDTHYAQRLYDRAMLLLQGVLSGEIDVIDPSTGDELPGDDAVSMGTLDFFPVDATDRAFTMGQQF